MRTEDLYSAPGLLQGRLAMKTYAIRLEASALAMFARPDAAQRRRAIGTDTVRRQGLLRSIASFLSGGAAASRAWKSANRAAYRRRGRLQCDQLRRALRKAEHSWQHGRWCSPTCSPTSTITLHAGSAAATAAPALQHCPALSQHLFQRRHRQGRCSSPRHQLIGIHLELLGCAAD